MSQVVLSVAMRWGVGQCCRLLLMSLLCFYSIHVCVANKRIWIALVCCLQCSALAFKQWSFAAKPQTTSLAVWIIQIESILFPSYFKLGDLISHFLLLFLDDTKCQQLALSDHQRQRLLTTTKAKTNLPQHSQYFYLISTHRTIHQVLNPAPTPKSPVSRRGR